MPLTDLAHLAELIRQVQSRFVRSAEPHRVFDGLLPDLLSLTGSEYGFIGEVWRSESGAPFLKIFTMTNIAWDAASRAHVERERINGIEFHNLKTLFGAALVTGAPVIANDAANDPRRGGLPHGHTPLNTFLGVPLHYGGEMVGMIGVANRPAYDIALIESLEPLFQSMAGIMAAVQIERQRRAAEEALEANDARWRHSFEMAGAGIAHVDASGAFLDINARMCQITGRPREQLLRLRFQDITHPDDLGDDVAALQRMVAGESVTQSLEKRYVRPDGSSLWVQIAAKPAQDPQGRFLHTVAIVLDIDQRRRAEEVLREREAQFTKLADRVPGVLLQFHVDLANHARVPYVSAALRDLFELEPEGPVRDDASLMIARVVKGQRGRVWGALEAGGRDLTPWAQEFEVDLPQRGRRWLEGRGTPERLADGSTLWHGYIDDITERKRYEDVLVAAEASRRANEAKTEFLSRMSHELRTPLNAVLGFTQLLANDPAAPLDEGQRTRLGHIERSGQHLLSMIGDVLDLSQVEAGNLPMQLRPLPVTQVIEESFVLIAPAARAAGVSLLHGGTPVDPALHVRADAMRLRQALANLLSNAVKYNRPGGQVIVDAKLVADAGRADADRPPGLVQIAVTDTGVGLSPAQQVHLFEPFNRLGAERSHVEGTGLGLAITLRLVEQMNGRIQVQSEAGRGSTFVVELPRSEPPPQDSEGLDGLDGFPSTIGPLSQSAGLPHVVLYAEDNELNVELVRQLLTLRAGCELRVARNGTEAIALARAQRPDLMLIDMHLGDMSGLDVLEALQGEAGLLGVPRIALSADALPQNIRIARERGFDEYITKPVDVAELLRCLERHLV